MVLTKSGQVFWPSAGLSWKLVSSSAAVPMFIGTAWCTGLSPKGSKGARWVVSAAHTSTGRLQYFLRGEFFLPTSLERKWSTWISLSTLYKLASFSLRVWFNQFSFFFFTLILSVAKAIGILRGSFRLTGNWNFTISLFDHLSFINTTTLSLIAHYNC